MFLPPRDANVIDLISNTAGATLGGLVAISFARSPAAKRRVMRPREAALNLLQEATAGPVAMVAGREDSGLTNAELDLCDALITIPTDPSHPSLNLAQAVAIMAYETWVAAGGEALPLKPPRHAADPATAGQLESLFADWTNALWAIDFFKTRRPEHVMRSLEHVRGETYVPAWYRVFPLIQTLAPGLVGRFAAKSGYRRHTDSN